MKKCRECGVELAIEQFPSVGDGGYKSLCPDCYLEHERERYQEKRQRYQEEGYDIPKQKTCGSCDKTRSIDKFRINLASKDKHQSQCKECCAEYERKYHRENRDDILEYQREWRRENDPGNRWAVERKKRKRKLDGDYTISDVYMQWHNQNGECFWCGKRCGSQPCHHSEYEVDHLTPVSRAECGPTDYPRNLVIACPECNASKGNKLPIEFKRYRLKYCDADQTFSQGVSV